MMKTYTATEDRFNNFVTLNATLWFEVIRYQSGISVLAAVEIVKNMLEITKKFNPELLEVMSEIGAEELQVKLQIAKEAGDTVWQTIKNIATKPDYTTIFMIVTLAMITFTMICLVRALKYGNT